MIKPDGEHRVSKTDTYLNVAEAFAYRSTCIKRKYGAVIVKNDVVVSTGYNGSPGDMTTAAISESARGWKGICIRERAMISAALSMQNKMHC